MKLVREAVNCRLYVMLRPRGGDFLYSNSELQVTYLRHVLILQAELNPAALTNIAPLLLRLEML